MLKKIKEVGSFEAKDAMLKSYTLEFSIPLDGLNEEMKKLVEHHKGMYKNVYTEAKDIRVDFRILLSELLSENDSSIIFKPDIRLYLWEDIDGKVFNEYLEDCDIDFSEEGVAELKKLVQDRIIIFE
jgi:hypothetical protein